MKYFNLEEIKGAEERTYLGSDAGKAATENLVRSFVESADSDDTLRAQVLAYLAVIFYSMIGRANAVERNMAEGIAKRFASVVAALNVIVKTEMAERAGVPADSKTNAIPGYGTRSVYTSHAKSILLADPTKADISWPEIMRAAGLMLTDNGIEQDPEGAERGLVAKLYDRVPKRPRKATGRKSLNVATTDVETLSAAFSEREAAPTDAATIFGDVTGNVEGLDVQKVLRAIMGPILALAQRDPVAVSAFATDILNGIPEQEAEQEQEQEAEAVA